jgi:hypothetical protein
VTATLRIPTLPVYGRGQHRRFHVPHDIDRHAATITARLQQGETAAASRLERFDELTPGEIEVYTASVLSDLAAVLRTVTRQQKRERKLSANEKRVLRILGNRETDRATDRSLQTLLRDLEKERGKKKHNRMHRAILSGSGLKRAIGGALDEGACELRELHRPGGGITADPQECATIMAEALGKLGGDPEFQAPEDLWAKIGPHIQPMPSSTFTSPTRQEFDTIVNRQKPTKATGRDDLNIFTLTLLPPQQLCWIYRAVAYYSTHPIPPQFLEGEVVLLHKGGNPLNPTQYRPISLLGVIYKIVSKHVTNALTAMLTKHNVLFRSQYGFRAKHRTSDHIISLVDKLTSDPRQYLTFFDFSKAFNSVPHTALFRIMGAYNVPPSLIKTVQRLYEGAVSFPVVRGHTAAYADRRGVHQGCAMSPLLFALFINPLLHLIASLLDEGEEMKAFADDLLLVSPHPHVHDRIVTIFRTIGRDMGLALNIKKKHSVTEQDRFPTSPWK